MGFERQPTELSLSRSPILYTIYDVAVEGTDFMYQLIVHVWRGSVTTVPPTAYTYTLRKFKDVDNMATFDVSKLVNGMFTDIHYSLPSETSGNLAVNVQCDAYYIDNTGAASIIGASPIIQAQWGYNYFNEEINHIVSKRNNGWLTDIPDTIQMPSDMHMSLFVRHSDTSDSTKVVFSSDAGIGEFVPVGITGPPTSSEETLLNYKVGPADIPASIRDSLIQYYTVRLQNATNVGTTREIKIYVKNPCKYVINKVDFLNKYGVWDRLVFYGVNKKEISVKSESSMRNVPFDTTGDEWKQSAGQFVLYNKSGRDKIEVNTGWVSEDYNEMIKQLFLSERVVFDGHAAQLIDKTFKFKTHINEKLINYTLTFEYSFTSINTIK